MTDWEEELNQLWIKVKASFTNILQNPPIEDLSICKDVFTLIMFRQFRIANINGMILLASMHSLLWGKFLPHGTLRIGSQPSSAVVLNQSVVYTTMGPKDSPWRRLLMEFHRLVDFRNLRGFWIWRRSLKKKRTYQFSPGKEFGFPCEQYNKDQELWYVGLFQYWEPGSTAKLISDDYST